MEPSHTALMIAVIAGSLITAVCFAVMIVCLRQITQMTRAVAGLVYQEEEKTRALLRQAQRG
ncbi:MAG TPA: hypothetical protein VGX21_22725 [Methylomirabilota bacterium]|nr:hypothetical protein [Methylomirabilota bacterium]